MIEITASIVTYFTKEKHLLGASESFLKANLRSRLVLVDNSQSKDIELFASNHNIDYIKMPSNKGFGAGHNTAIKKFASDSEFFLILNPDIVIPNGTLEYMCDFMRKNKKVVLSTCLIKNPDDTIQYVHKRLPSFSILFTRRFMPSFLKSYFQKELDKYILKDQSFEHSLKIPNVSGCFMLFRTDALLALNGFDEKFFMYLEDIDISRRSCHLGEVVLLPNVFVYHEWARGSYHNFKLMWVNIKSTFIYFWKWFGKNKDLSCYQVERFKDNQN